jgi:hypothetical protein
MLQKRHLKTLATVALFFLTTFFAALLRFPIICSCFNLLSSMSTTSTNWLHANVAKHNTSVSIALAVRFKNKKVKSSLLCNFFPEKNKRNQFANTITFKFYTTIMVPYWYRVSFICVSRQKRKLYLYYPLELL